MKKPKCEGCGKIGEEKVYYWHQTRGGGSLWHYECYKKIVKEINK